MSFEIYLISRSILRNAGLSLAAVNIRSAIYDKPMDTVNFLPAAEILETVLTLENSGVSNEPIEVEPGNIVADTNGNLS